MTEFWFIGFLILCRVWKCRDFARFRSQHVTWAQVRITLHIQSLTEDWARKMHVTVSKELYLLKQISGAIFRWIIGH